MDIFENWNEEKQSAYLYEIMAQNEKNPTRKNLFLNLAKAANKQAGMWEVELKKTSSGIPKDFHPSLRTHIIAVLIKIFGAKRLRYMLAATKIRGMSIYTDKEPNQTLAPVVPNHEMRHKTITSAGNLRAAIFGVNDGLISNMSLILGMVGAQSSQHILLLTGVAGLLAGACSMGAGEYISVRSQRELFEYQIGLERSELEQYPQEEAAELSFIYQARGLPKDEADRLSKLVISNPEKALDTLAREELGLNPNELGSPVGVMVSSFVSFAIGAFIPLLPFLISNYAGNLKISLLLTGVSLFSIGAILSLFTNCSALKSGLRMLLIGSLAGGLTYLIGHILGVTLQ